MRRLGYTGRSCLGIGLHRPSVAAWKRLPHFPCPPTTGRLQERPRELPTELTCTRGPGGVLYPGLLLAIVLRGAIP